MNPVIMAACLFLRLACAEPEQGVLFTLDAAHTSVTRRPDMSKGSGYGTIAGTYGSGASGGSGQTRGARKGAKPIIADNPSGKYKGYTPGNGAGRGVTDPSSPRRPRPR